MTRLEAPPPWTEADPGRPVPFWESLCRDVIAHIPHESRGKTRWGWAWAAIVVALRSTSFHVTTLYRLGHLLRHRAGPPGRVLAGLLFWWGRHWYGCAIASGARLHGGLMLPHPQGIVIGSGVVVGPWSYIYQNVTIGGAPGKVGLPRVGAEARIYAGAVLTGPITVGDHSILGANVVVGRDVPDRTVVRCPLPNLSYLTERAGADGRDAAE